MAVTSKSSANRQITIKMSLKWLYDKIAIKMRNDVCEREKKTLW